MSIFRLLLACLLVAGTAVAQSIDVDIPSLPAGKQVQIIYSTTVNASPTGVAVDGSFSISQQAEIKLAGHPDVLTDDPDLPGATDATAVAGLVLTSADLSIAVSDGQTVAVPGSGVTYTILVTNNGPDAVSGVVVQDSFPAALLGVTYTSVTTGTVSGNTASGSGNINDTVSMSNGATITYTAVGTIDSSATGSLPNVATVSSGFDPTPGNNSATDTDTLIPEADLSVTVTDGVTSAVPGAGVTYTIVVTNNGSSDVASASFTDSFPVTLTGVTYTSVAAGGATGNTAAGAGDLSETLSLPSGASVTYTVSATIASNATGSLANTASVSSSVTDPTPSNDSATDTDTLTPEADLSVAVTDGVTSVVPGTMVTYTILVSNSGSSDVSSATLTDSFPATLTGVTYTSVAAGGATGNTAAGAGNLSETLALPAGASVTYTVSATVVSDATGSLVNTASVTSATTDPSSANNSATDTDTLTPQADLSVTVTDGVTSVVPGAGVTYTIVVANGGSSDVPSAMLTDSFPATLTGVTYTSVAAGGATGNTAAGAGDLSETLALPAGASVTYTVSATVASDATGSLVNTASVTSATTDPSSANNSATDTDTLTPQADLSVTVTDGQTTAVPGASITYTIVVANGGSSDVPSATLTDSFPATLTGVTYTSVAAGGATGNTAAGAGDLSETLALPAGASVTYTVSATVAATATGSLANSASVSSSVTDPTPSNDSATDTDTLIPEADLSVTVTDGVTSVVPGAPITYTIVVTNNGSSDVASATLTDTFSDSLTGVTYTSIAAGGATGNTAAGAGNLSEALALPAGSSVTYTVSATVSVSATGSLVNTASVSSATADPTPANNSATDTNTVIPQADLAITISDGQTTAVPGASITYTIVATNVGPNAVTSASITDAFPATLTGVSYTSIAAGGATGNTAAGSGDLNETVDMPAGASITYTVSATVASSATGSLANTAIISSLINDPTSGNNSATDTNTLTPQADLSIAMSDDVDPIIAGNQLTYTIVVTNTGPSDVVAASVVDTFDAIITNASYTSISTGTVSGNTTAGSGNISDTVDMSAGATLTYTVLATIDTEANGPLSNTATVSASIDSNAANNSVTESTIVLGGVDIVVAAVASTESVIAGDGLPLNLTYEYTVTNNGPLTATELLLELTHFEPVGVLVDSIIPEAGADYDDSTGAWTISSLASGASTKLTVSYGVGASTAAGVDVITSAVSVTSVEQPLITVGDDSAGLATSVSREVDLVVAVDVLHDPLVAGGDELDTFRVSVTNDGPSDASGVELLLTSVLPSDVSFTNIVAALGSYDAGVWTVGVLPAGGSATLTFTTQAGSDAVSGTGVVPLAFEVSAVNESQSNIANDVASAATSIISVADTDASISVAATIERQSGLFIGKVTVTNENSEAIPAFRLYVKNLPEDVQVYNANGTRMFGDPAAELPYVLYNYPLEGAASVTLSVEFFRPTMDPDFTPVYEVELLAVAETVPGAGTGGFDVTLMEVLGNGDVLIEVASIPGHVYVIEYSADMSIWNRVSPSVTAPANRLQWIDNGPPKTEIRPSEVRQRFYRVVDLTADID